jgi:hypothetical protein
MAHGMSVIFFGFVVHEGNMKMVLTRDLLQQRVSAIEERVASEDALEAMDLAYRQYIGPGSAGRDAYLFYEGRPVIFVFPKRGGTDWSQVRQQLNRWDTPPILLYKDDPPPVCPCF